MFNRCEGLPNGACPDNRQDKTVKNTDYDLFLCPACEKTRDDKRSTATGVFKEGSKKVNKQPAEAGHKEARTTTAKSVLISFSILFSFSLSF